MMDVCTAIPKTWTKHNVCMRVGGCEVYCVYLYAFVCWCGCDCGSTGLDVGVGVCGCDSFVNKLCRQNNGLKRSVRKLLHLPTRARSIISSCC